MLQLICKIKFKLCFPSPHSLNHAHHLKMLYCYHSVMYFWKAPFFAMVHLSRVLMFCSVSMCRIQFFKIIRKLGLFEQFIWIGLIWTVWTVAYKAWLFCCIGFWLQLQTLNRFHRINWLGIKSAVGFLKKIRTSNAFLISKSSFRKHFSKIQPSILLPL